MPTGPIELPGNPEDYPKGAPPGFLPPGGNGGGGGGGIGGGPGGFSGGFGGGTTSFAPPGIGQSLSPYQRRLGVGANPGMAMNGGGQDTVPAMLSPGEFVVNSQAAQHPAISQLLMMLNQAGGAQPPQATGMAGGGYVHDGFSGIHPAVAQLIYHMACGGYVPGYVGGGYVNNYNYNPNRGNTGGYNYNPGGWSGRTGGGTNSPGWGQDNQPMPQAQPATPAPTPPNSQTGGPATPGAFGNPYSETGGYNDTSGREADYMRGLYSLLGQYGSSGSFSPGGSSQYMNALSGQAKTTQDALTQRALTGADVYGMDPSQAGATRMQALMGTNRDAAANLTGAYAGLLGNQQQFGQGLMSQMNNFNLNDQSQINQFLRQWQLPGHGMGQQQGGGANWAGLLGAGAGAGIGGFFGGLPGATLGAGIGGQLHP